MSRPFDFGQILSQPSDLIKLITFVNFEKFALVFFIFSIPSSLAYHVRLSEASILSHYVDYLMPALFISDLAVILCCFAWLINVWRGSAKFIPLNLIAFLTIAILLLPGVRLVAWQSAYYAYGRFLLGAMLFFVLRFQVKRYQQLLGRALIAALVFQSIFALLQFLIQHNLTPYYFLGETTLSNYSPSIAKLYFGESSFIRAYGTTPHPNVLGGYLVIGLILVNIIRRKIPGWLLVLVLAALFVTFSRSAWVGMLIFLMLGRPGLLKKGSALIITGLITMIGLGLLFLNPIHLNSLSVIERITYSAEAVRIFLAHPISGVGLNQFIYYLLESNTFLPTVRTLQPVHNVFLLFLAEVGIFGIGLGIMFTAWLATIFTKSAPSIKALIVVILWLMMVDHYLVTLPEGFYLLVFALSCVSVEKGQTLKGLSL